MSYGAPGTGDQVTSPYGRYQYVDAVFAAAYLDTVISHTIPEVRTPTDIKYEVVDSPGGQVFRGVKPAGAGYLVLQASTAGTYRLRLFLEPGEDKTARAATVLAAVSGVGGFHSGDIIMTASATVPAGWFLCNGQAVSRTDYAALFAAIGVVFGVGNGTTTFNVPDLRGAAPIGAGTGAGLTNRVLGTLVGAETVALVTANMPAHTHTVPTGQGSFGVTTGGTTMTPDFSGLGPYTTSSQGSGTAHANMQPSLPLNFIIKQ